MQLREGSVYRLQGKARSVGNSVQRYVVDLSGSHRKRTTSRKMEMSEHEVVPYREQLGALSAQDVRAQVNLIQEIMKEVMHKDEHYGVVPGTGTKPTLLKAGAEKLCLTFRLAPDYEIEIGRASC